MNMGILSKTKCYMIGHMQYGDGQPWRKYVKRHLNPLGITCFDPYIKPFVNDIPEDDEARAKLTRNMDIGNFDEVAEHMKQVRAHDLNLCDRSDLIIGKITPSVPSWGTPEELVTSVRMKKPIFLAIEGGKNKCPLWIMGMIPHKYIYNSEEEIVKMIKNINNGTVKIDSDRWRLLQHQYR